MFETPNDESKKEGFQSTKPNVLDEDFQSNILVPEFKVPANLPPPKFPKVKPFGLYRAPSTADDTSQGTFCKSVP